MELNLKDVSELLHLSEKNLFSLIQKKKIPFYKINQQYRFNRSEINEWILKNNVKISKKALKLSASSEHIKLTDVLKKGGIFYNIAGNSVEEVIKNAASFLRLPKEITKEIIISILLEREEMMPTAVGNGIAIPHPRTPLIADIEYESVSICFLEHPIDYHALDKKLVHTLFIIMSANSRRHLEILSKTAYFCQQNDFIEMLQKKISSDEIIKYIENKEKEFSGV